MAEGRAETCMTFISAATSSRPRAPPRSPPWPPAARERCTPPKPEQLAPTADTVIVLWMAGGMAHTETFDPKRYTPFETGMRARRRC